MKYCNIFASLLLACSVVISALFICKEIEKSTAAVSQAINGIDTELWQLRTSNQAEDYDEILSLYETAGYLKMDQETILKMIEDGELQGTYFQKGTTGGYCFVREALYQWCLTQAKK